MSTIKKVLFCWSDISGYMVACWKALNQMDSIDLHMIAFEKSDQTAFQKEMTSELTIRFVNREPKPETISAMASQINPDVIVLCGWFVPAYKKLADDATLKENTKFILAMDTPWWGKSRQQLAPYVLKSFVKKMDAVITSGERSYQYAQRLGSKTIFKIQYGVDALKLKEAYYERIKSDWPKRFLFVGRFAEEKGIDVLVKSYREYRKEVTHPWPLDACGQGPLVDVLAIEGITNHGFVQPLDMIKNWEQAGCLVLASTFDPWPLIVVEACAAGLPVIVTHASGSQVEVVKVFYNGLVITEGSIEDLKNAMIWMHEHYNALSAMGYRSLSQAAPYDAQIWAQKFNYMLEILC
jgi:glycosyltransferase involved in cell wall biosynthesis